MEKKNSLLIIMIASILVIAGFSVNEKAYAANHPPPFGDFTCWSFDEFDREQSGPELFASDADLILRDQFEDIENNDWRQIDYCTATEKNGEPSPFTPDSLAQHYQGWLYPLDTEGPGTGITVIITVPQFDYEFQAELGFLDSLRVPADKELPGDNFIESVDTEQHWNCYEISGPAPDTDPVSLVTQHGNINNVIVDTPSLFCLPVIKDHGGESFPEDEVLIDEHMVCYDIFVADENDDNTINLPIALDDQLEPDVPIETVLFLDSLCVPAIKSFPTVGGSDVSINSSALLLAGAESISMWMIPVVIAGIGIGIFVIKRRK